MNKLINIPINESGRYTIGYLAIDAVNNPLGNASNPLNITVGLDLVQPNLTVQYPLATNYSSSTVPLGVIASDDLSGVANCTYSLDGAANVSVVCNSEQSISSLNDGQHTIDLYVVDNAGNVRHSSVTFVVNEKPVIDLVEPFYSPLLDAMNLTLNISVTDNTNVSKVILEFSMVKN